MDQALYNRAAALRPMAISTTITMIANQSRRMAGDSFIARTLLADVFSRWLFAPDQPAGPAVVIPDQRSL